MVNDAFHILQNFKVAVVSQVHGYLDYFPGGQAEGSPAVTCNGSDKGPAAQYPAPGAPMCSLGEVP